MKLSNIGGFEKLKALPKLLRIAISKLFDVAKKTPHPNAFVRVMKEAEIRFRSILVFQLVNAVLQIPWHLLNSMQSDR